MDDAGKKFCRFYCVGDICRVIIDADKEKALPGVTSTRQGTCKQPDTTAFALKRQEDVCVSSFFFPLSKPLYAMVPLFARG